MEETPHSPSERGDISLDVVPVAFAPPQSTMAAAGIADEDKACRICMEPPGDGDDPSHELIAPCLCKGTQKWVHRYCLDRWRVMNTGHTAFYECGTCNFRYHMNLPEDQSMMNKKNKFRALVARDSFLFLCVVQLVIVVLAVFMWRVDEGLSPPNKMLHAVFEHKGGDHCNPSGHCELFKSFYYMAGVLLFFFLIGVTVTVMYCCQCCCDGSHSSGYHDNVTCLYCCDSYYGPTYCYCPQTTANDCNCNCCPGGGGGGGGDCKCDGEAGGVLLVIAIALIAVFVLIGIVYGLFMLCVIVQKILSRHAHILQRRVYVRAFKVMDLSGVNLHGDGNSDATTSSEHFKYMTPNYDLQLLRDAGLY